MFKYLQETNQILIMFNTPQGVSPPIFLQELC